MEVQELGTLDPIKEFNDGVDKVRSLLEFDKELLSFCADYLEKMAGGWEPRFKAQYQGVQAVIQTLRNSREEERLKPKFQIIANQGVVLLVSYFSAALFNLFRKHVVQALQTGLSEKASQEFEIKVPARRLIELTKEHLELGTFIAEKRGYSFQNVEDICTAFEDHFKVPLRDADLKGRIDMIRTRNDVQLALACRNVIVHQGTVIDSRFVRQIRNANPRTLLTNLKSGEPINFSSDEVLFIATEMQKLLAYIESETQQRLKLQMDAYRAS